MSAQCLDVILNSDDGFTTSYQRKQARDELAQLRADLQAAQERIAQLEAALAFGDAEQARQLDEARAIFRKYVMHELSYGSAWHEMCDWIEENPAPANHVHLSAGGRCVICGLPAPEAESQ